MTLKKNCEKCSTVLRDDGIAYHCSYGCTFCEKCSDEMNLVCPNCIGELVRRPVREINTQ